MGIKFRCPNGHKLNVKSFLAGKRGVCPDCGQTFRIPPEGTYDSEVVAMPLESRRNGSAGPDENGVPFGENLEESDFETAIAVAAAAVEPEQAFSVTTLPAPTIPSSTIPSSALPAPAFPAVQDVTFLPPKPASGPAAAPAASPDIFFPAVKPAAAPATAPPPAPQAPQAKPLPPADPIAEAPDCVWYVRPPNGGQYGPARADIMRKWIAEGRVSGDSLVWRDGWAEWRDASQLFPSLSSAGAATPAAAGPIVPATVAPSAAPRATERKVGAKKASNDLAVAALVCLVLVCLILVTVLAIVLSQGGG